MLQILLGLHCHCKLKVLSHNLVWTGLEVAWSPVEFSLIEVM